MPASVLTDTSAKVLDIGRAGAVSSKDVQRALGIGQSGANKVLVRLVELGLMSRSVHQTGRYDRYVYRTVVSLDDVWSERCSFCDAAPGSKCMITTEGSGIKWNKWPHRERIQDAVIRKAAYGSLEGGLRE